MPGRLPPLNALKAFESAARHLSLKRAAQELNVTPAAISHQVKALEDYLGVKLFLRLNRALKLTATARAALPKLSEGFGSLAQAVAALRPQTDSGQVTVSVAPSFATRWLMPRLHHFFAVHPEIDVRVSARMRLVTRGGQANAAERTTIANWLEESDLAILYGHGDYPDFRVDRLFALTVAPICSPQLIRGENPLREPQDLRHHTLLHDDTGMLYDGVAFWDVWLKAVGASDVDSSRGSHFSHAVLALEAAIDALGVVATFPVLAAAELAAGRLIMPFAFQAPLQSAYYLVCAEGAELRTSVAAFRDWLLAEASQQEQH
ncbi:MAG: transcriptional regulator GcvA [Betaproteobacteria bacterium]|nr:transcriptional regulator GcvA [Betaproteobacteria bacterium]